MHKILFAPQTWDLLEKLALIFLYNFHREHVFLKLIRKTLSPKINVKNIKNRVYKIVSNEDPGVRTHSAGLLSLSLLHYVPCKRHLA